ncbi:glycosyltransferase family 2 protein [Candidatus Woesearchaeota archaeon]|nr:glycosyltransferase family 2 protein [Candidatus Woesearchaeota archaeon]
MKVSIIIVNYNGKYLLKKILASIYRSEFKDCNIIVLDNASTDGSREFLRKKHPKIIVAANESNLGYSGINNAIRHCKGKYILFLNNDMELEKNAIGKLVAALESDSSVAMAAPKLVNYYNKSLVSGGTWVSRAFYNGHIKGNGKNSTKEIPYLGVGMIRKDFVEKFGYLFDPDYFIYAEDLDLGLRIRLAGKKVLFEPNAVMYHMHAATTKKSGRSFTTFLMERNLLTTFLKILSPENIILFAPYVLAMRLLAAIRDLVALDASSALARLRAMLWIVFNMDFILKKRKVVQKMRKADDKFILKVFSERYLFKPFVI